MPSAEATMASTATIRDTFDQSDQARIRADLAAFFGPHADSYLLVYDRMRRRSKDWVASWSWPSFFAPVPWLFYRKLYLYGALCFAIPVAIGLLFDETVAGGAAIVIAVSAKAWYVSAGLRRIAEADRLELEGDERRDYLRHMGGVSPAAGWLVGVLHIALAMFIVSQIVANGIDGSGGNDEFERIRMILSPPQG
jgi:hypothetical protein